MTYTITDSSFFASFQSIIIFALYFSHVYQIVCATLMTENKQQVVSEKSHLMMGGLVEQKPALLAESPDYGV
jgi:hypothetical protein